MEHKISSDIDIFTRYIGCHISALGTRYIGCHISALGAAFFASGANFWYVFSTQLASGANTTLLRRFIFIFSHHSHPNHIPGNIRLYTFLLNF
jgi:hypothetical protein